MKNYLLKIALFLFSFCVSTIFILLIFMPIFKSNSIIFTFSITPFDIAQVYPKIWDYIKKTYFVFLFISYFIIFNYIYNNIEKYFSLKKKTKNNNFNKKQNFENDDLKILIGVKHERTTCFYE